MANSTLAQLAAAGTLDGTEIVPITKGGTTVRTTTGAFAGLVTSNMPVSKSLNGLLGWTFDPAIPSGSTLTPAAGVLNLFRVPWTTTQTVTNIVGAVVTAGATVANAFLGIYNETGLLLAQSADISATLQSTGTKTIPLASPTSIPATSSGFVWVGLLIGSAGTFPTFPRGGFTGNFINLGTTAATSRAGSYSTGQTALPTPLTPASITQSNFGALFGLN